VNSTTLDNSIEDYITEFQVSDFALKLARQMIGIGFYKTNEETVSFIVGFNGALPTSGGAYDEHGKTSYTVGLNTDSFIRYMKDLKEWTADVTAALAKKHWTWLDLKVSLDPTKHLTTFNIQGKVQGIAETEMYRPVRSSVRFSDSPDGARNGWMEDVVLPNPADAHTSGSIKYGLQTGSLVPVGVAWVYLFIHTALGLRDQDRLYFPRGMPVKEIYMWIIVNLLTYSGKSSHASSSDLSASRLHLVEMVDAIDPNLRHCLAYATSETLRFEQTEDVLKDANSTVQRKYGIGVVQKIPTFTTKYTGPRPKGLRENSLSRINKFGDNTVQRKLIASAFKSMAIKGSSASAPAPKPPTGQAATSSDSDVEED
jgi:hypothetical protein